MAPIDHSRKSQSVRDIVAAQGTACQIRGVPHCVPRQGVRGSADGICRKSLPGLTGHVAIVDEIEDPRVRALPGTFRQRRGLAGARICNGFEALVGANP